MNVRSLPRFFLSEGWVMRLALLMGQSVSMGVTLSLLVIIASSLFLAEFGAQTLPYVYLSVAVIGSLLVYGLAALQRRWALPRLAMTTIALLSVFYFVCWLGVTAGGLRWLSFALVVSFSFVIQIGFVFLGGQAGRLLDVRQIKRLFPQVVAGFVIGFILGAFIAPLLINLLDSAENALIGLTASSLIWLVFLALTNRRYHTQLSLGDADNKRPSQGQPQPNLSLRQALGKRSAMLIFGYLMLAAMVNQLSDFLLMAQAGERYPDANGLAQFFSSLTAGLNLTDLIFTTLIAGFLLSRFGLRLGLVANPIVMLLLFLVMAIAGPTFGLSSWLFFALVVAARIINISLEDGMTRASVNAAYQAIPVQARVMVQTGVEGIGVPLALGIVGILLLIFNALPGLSLIHLTVLTLILSAGWVIASAAVYRNYKTALVDTLRYQVLSEGEELFLDDAATQAAVFNLLRSEKIHEVRLALDVLERAGHASFEPRLVELLDHSNEAVRVEALKRIEQHPLAAALPGVEAALQAPGSTSLKAAALRALCALKEGDADARVTVYLQDASVDLRLAAMVGLLRYGGIPGALVAGPHLLALQGSRDRKARLFQADVIREIGEASLYRLLAPLLEDDDPEVRWTALQAAGKLHHPALLQGVADHLNVKADRAAATVALTEYGAGALPLVEKVLTGARPGASEDDARQAARLARICGRIGGLEIQAFLKTQILHPVNEVRHQVFLALQRCNYCAGAEDLPVMQQAMINEAVHAAHLLEARRDLGEAEELSALLRALDEELASVRQRLFLLLSFQIETRAILNAERRLASDNESERAMALEALEITLPGALKSLILPLVDEHMPAAQRIQRLNRQTTLPQQSRQDRLQDLIANPNGMWQANWVRACAIYAAGSMTISACRAAIEKALHAPDATLQETAAWALNRLSPQQPAA